MANLSFWRKGVIAARDPCVELFQHGGVPYDGVVRYETVVVAGKRRTPQPLSIRAKRATLTAATYRSISPLTSDLARNNPQRGPQTCMKSDSSVAHDTMHFGAETRRCGEGPRCRGPTMQSQPYELHSHRWLG